MGDPVAELAKEEKVEDKPGEEAATKKEEVSNAEVVVAVREVRDALTKPNKPVPTREEIRQALKDKSGFTDAQLDVVEGMNNSIFKQSAARTAELEEKVAWSEFKEDLGGKIDPAIEKIMKEELTQYDVALRGDKVLLKKVFYLAKGIQAEKVEKTRKDNAGNDKPNDNENIVDRRIVNDKPGSTQGLENSGGKPAGGDSNLSDDEKMVASKMGIKAEDYAKAKGTKIISQLKGSK